MIQIDLNNDPFSFHVIHKNAYVYTIQAVV